MRTDELDYELPPELIATEPASPRDAARLLVDLGRDVAHRTVAELPTLVRPGDVVVVNDTRVRPARLRFRRPTGGAAEVLLLEAPEADAESTDEAAGWWEALVRPSAKVAPGTVLEVGDGLSVEVGEDLGEGRRRVRLHHDGDLDAVLGRLGELPLPPYLGDLRLDDPERYQTVFARRAASAAAPTAGLHLTPEVLAGIEAAGASVVPVELVVGLGTFRPIATDVVADHVMHAERYVVPEATWAAVQRAERVVAVGTTSVRALESAAARGELSGRTDLFIRPGFDWQVVDVLMTNFHLPRSSLLAMVDAFVGPRWRELYDRARHDGYRFLSFGDALWLTRHDRREAA